MNYRDRILTRNISLGVLYKILNMGVAFITIPIVLKYLGHEKYGIWVTIFSIVNIIVYLDGGIINGLKTKLSEALGEDNLKDAKHYISSAYFLLTFFSFLLLAIGTVLIYFIDLQSILNTTVDQQILKSTFYIILCTLIVGFILNLYKPLYYANQQSSIVELSMLLFQCLTLIMLLVFLNYFRSSLVYVAILYGTSSIMTGIIFTILFFKGNHRIMPSSSFFNKRLAKTLFSLSMEFFIIQLSMIIIFSTDNIIIARLMGPEEVTKYDVVLKLFQILITFSIIIQDPYWAMYSDAYKKGDLSWIKKTIRNWNKFFIGFILIVMIIIPAAKPIIRFWLQQELNLPSGLILLMGVFVIIRVYGIIYMYFLNGIGKVKLQMWLYVFGAIINIPLSIFFVKYLNLGSSGVILGTIVSLLGMTIALPIQYLRIINK